MPSPPEHPVTLGDLYVKDGSETFISLAVRPATVVDLVSALGGPGGMLDLLIKGGFLKVVVRTVGIEHHVYYEVAEAQPFPPAGGVS